MLGKELLADYQYRYDANGNRVEKKQMGPSGGTYVTSYAYDHRNRLKQVHYPDRKEELFYDRAGNRIMRVTTEPKSNAGREERYHYDARNRLIKYYKDENVTTFSYDAAGNLLMDDQATYSYDAFNRNTKVEMFNSNVQINHYDSEGLRYEMEENGKLVSFIFRGEEVITEETREQKIRYIRTHELVASDAKNARTYYHYAADEMGSITHVIDGECVLNHYTYDAWGVPTVCKETVENRFRFNGQQYDPVSRQYYMRARFYNPVIARFTQEDSYRGDGLNLYSYCENNPVYYIDPSGHYVCASGVKRRTEDVRRRTATRDEYKSLSSHLREKLRNGKPLTPSEKAAAENLGIDVNRKCSKSDSKAEVLAQNRAKGRAFEQQEFAKFNSKNNNAVEQITVKTSSGVRTRVDAIGLDANGNVVINEYKSSLTAPLTDNQKIAFPEIFESGATVVGKGKGIFSGGYPIPPATKVTIIRPE